MANASFRNRRLVIAFSPAFKVQADLDVPIASADLNSRHPQTTPAFHSNINFRDQTRDCSGEFVTVEQLTGKISRFTFAFEATVQLMAGWYAYLKSVAAAPTGSAADEVQTINLHGATGGTATFNLDFEGLSGVSSAISTTAALTAAQLQAALETARAIKPGNVAVTGSAGGPFTVTFRNRLAKANLPLLTVTDSSTGGTGVTVASSANGDNHLHAITAIETGQPALFSVIEGFEGDIAKRYKNLVMSDWSIAIPRRGKPTLTIVACGDPEPDIISGYTFPDCFAPNPIRTADVRVKVGSNWITSDIRDITYAESNNIDVSEDALKFDDITPERLESGDRTATLTALISGAPSAALYAFADDEDTAFDTLELHLGRPGERLSIFAGNTQFKLDDSSIEFTGTRNKSAFRLTGRPSPDGSSVVTRGEYRSGTFSTQLLGT